MVTHAAAQRQLDESFSIPRLDDGELVTTEMVLLIGNELEYISGTTFILPMF